MKTSKDGKTYPCECGKNHGITILCLKSSEDRQGWVKRKIADANPEEKLFSDDRREIDPHADRN
tara:strand:+ start:1313 stop:1504 length:192 start_codon:yes stop_codon:yes gene_type:complete